MYRNPVRKVKPSKIEPNLIIKGNNSHLIKKLPGAIILNIIKLINPGIMINGNLKDLTTLQGYKN